MVPHWDIGEEKRPERLTGDGRQYREGMLGIEQG